MLNKHLRTTYKNKSNNLLIFSTGKKVNAFLPHKRRICIIFEVYDADSDKMMQIQYIQSIIEEPELNLFPDTQQVFCST